MSYIIGLTHWDASQLRQIGRLSTEVQGIILGDPFCQRRTFQSDKTDMFSLAEQACEYGLKVVFQTPVYLPPRNYQESIDNIRALTQKNLIHMVLAQNLGLLEAVAGVQVPICWSLWGDTRNKTLNKEFVDLLKEMGVSYIETDVASRIAALQQHGIRVAYRLQSSPVATFGRSCYHTKTAGMVCANDHRPCLEQPVYLTEKDSQDRLLVDGHTLCWDRLVPFALPEVQPDIMTIFARDVSSLPDIIFRGQPRDPSEAYRRLHRRLTVPPTTMLLDALSNMGIELGIPLATPEVASVLYTLVSSIRPKRILEIGGGCGYVAALLATASADSHIVTIECDAKLAAEGQSVLRESDLAQRLVWQIGDARQIIPSLTEQFDFVFIDAAKQEYPDYLRAVLPRLAPGAVILTDDTTFADTACDYDSARQHIETGLREFHKVIHQRPFLTSPIQVGQGLLLTKYLGERNYE